MDGEVRTDPAADTASGAIRAFQETVRPDPEGIEVFRGGKTTFGAIMRAQAAAFTARGVDLDISPFWRHGSPPL
jgi:hypothetical protein